MRKIDMMHLARFAHQSEQAIKIHLPWHKTRPESKIVHSIHAAYVVQRFVKSGDSVENYSNKAVIAGFIRNVYQILTFGGYIINDFSI